METILGLIRHVLTFGGGYLANKGFIAASDVELAVGAAITLIGIVWSALAKSDKVPLIK